MKVVAWSPSFSRGPKRKSICYKLTMAGHHPWSPASWTLALHSPSQTLSPPGSVPAPGPTACSSWAWSLESLISLPMCQDSAVLRIVLFHIVGGEPANLERDREAVRAASLHILPLFLDTPARLPPASGPRHLPHLLPQEAPPPDTPSADHLYLLLSFTHVSPYP